VLRAVRGKPLTRDLVAQSPIVHVRSYFGGVSDFPLATPLKVKAGDFVGINVPTWAPLLAVGQSSAYLWRASRDRDSAARTSSTTPRS
jgi:hypothetical protein